VSAARTTTTINTRDPPRAQRHAAGVESRPISSKRARRPLVFRRSRPDTRGPRAATPVRSVPVFIEDSRCPERGRHGPRLSRFRDLDQGFGHPCRSQR
jgi:hypothetical protein